MENIFRCLHYMNATPAIPNCLFWYVCYVLVFPAIYTNEPYIFQSSQWVQIQYRASQKQRPPCIKYFICNLSLRYSEQYNYILGFHAATVCASVWSLFLQINPLLFLYISTSLNVCCRCGCSWKHSQNSYPAFTLLHTLSMFLLLDHLWHIVFFRRVKLKSCHI